MQIQGNMKQLFGKYNNKRKIIQTKNSKNYIGVHNDNPKDSFYIRVL